MGTQNPSRSDPAPHYSRYAGGHALRQPRIMWLKQFLWYLLLFL